MADVISAAERQAVYKKIFQSIPQSFLDPKHPHNQVLVGAIAYAVAYMEALYRQFESGLFLDSADAGTIGGDGLTGLARWGVWINMPQAPGESAEAYRLRLMQKLFTPRITISAIQNAVSAATGLPVTITEVGDGLVRFNDGAWNGRKVPGVRHNYGAISLVTTEQTAIPPHMMNFLRAAGIHWSHIETVRDDILVSLEGEQASCMVAAWDWTVFWPRGYRPNTPPHPGAWPLRPRFTYDVGESRAADARSFFSVRSMSVVGAIAAPFAIIEAENDGAERFPVLNWDDPLTLWGESVWGD